MTMTTTPTTPRTPTIQLLTLLSNYSTLHDSASTNLKSSIFNITKARRTKDSNSLGFGSVDYSCDDVREELRAVALLELNGGGGGGPADGENNNNDTLDLVQEAESAGGSRFILHLDGMKSASAAARQKDQHKQQQQQQDDDDNDDNIIATNNTENEGGLRRRKGGEKINTTNDELSNKWTIEQQEQEQEQQSIIQDDEEEKHVRNCNANPLNLFGVPPPALRVAQSKSRSALAYYVEVANLAREILEITNNNGNDQS